MFKVQVISFLMTLILLNTAHLQNITCKIQNVNQTSKRYTELEFESQQMLLPHKEPNVTRNITRIEVLAACEPVIVPNNERSVCPWTYVNNTDPNRIPVVLYEANCTTSGRTCRCVQTIQNQHRGPKCREIYHYVEVLRKVPCGNGRNEYKKVMERLVSGCGCFLPAGDACYANDPHRGLPACEPTQSEFPKTHEK